MTRKEWMQRHYPEKTGKKYIGGVMDCPIVYYDLPDRNITNCIMIDCESCWNKEMKVSE